MTRLTTILMTIFLIGVISPSIRAQDIDDTRESLKGINALFVVVELSDSAKILSLTKPAIQTDVESQLRLAGMRVVPPEEGSKVLGYPFLYVQIHLTQDAKVASVDVELDQNALLERNGELAVGVKTWDVGSLGEDPTAEGISGEVKNQVDQFASAWLSVNPKP